MKPSYTAHGGRHFVAIVLCPRILGNRLAHLSQDGPNSWVLRDFITRKMLRRTPTGGTSEYTPGAARGGGDVLRSAGASRNPRRRCQQVEAISGSQDQGAAQDPSQHGPAQSGVRQLGASRLDAVTGMLQLASVIIGPPLSAGLTSPVQHRQRSATMMLPTHRFLGLLLAIALSVPLGPLPVAAARANGQTPNGSSAILFVG